MGRRLAAIAVVTAAIVAVLVWYVAGYLMVSPPAVAAPATKGATPAVDLTLQTVAGLGNGYTEPTWVSYLVKDENGRLAAQHDLHRARALARPRDRLPVRHRDAACATRSWRGRRASSAT